MVAGKVLQGGMRAGSVRAVLQGGSAQVASQERHCVGASLATLFPLVTTEKPRGG